MRGYPYYLIVFWVGAMSCPARFKCVAHLRRMYETGRIGGKKRHEHRCGTYAEAVQSHHRERLRGRDPEMYVVRAPNRPRERIPVDPRLGARCEDGSHTLTREDS